jgi:hypothetical protein
LEKIDPLKKDLIPESIDENTKDEDS